MAKVGVKMMFFARLAGGSDAIRAHDIPAKIRLLTNALNDWANHVELFTILHSILQSTSSFSR